MPGWNFLSPDEWGVVFLTLDVATRSVVFGLPVAVLVAWLLARTRFPGRGLLDAFAHLPMVLPPVVVGWLLLLIFGLRGPVGAWLHAWFGIRLVFTTAGAALACAVTSFPLMLRAIRMVLGWRLRGRAWPNPFFARETRAPIYPITVLSQSDREALRRLCGPHPTARAEGQAAQ